MLSFFIGNRAFDRFFVKISGPGGYTFPEREVLPMDRRILSITVALILFLGVLITAHPDSPKVIATARPGIGQGREDSPG